MSKNLSSDNGQELLDTSKKKSAINALKTASKRAFDKRQKQQVIWLEIRLQKILQDPSEDPVKSAQPTEIPKKKYIPPEKWQQIFDELYYIYIKHEWSTRRSQIC